MKTTLGELKKKINELVEEARIREADVFEGGEGRKVEWGSEEHIKDLQRQIKELEFWRDRSARGSDKRANFQRVLSRLRADLKSALNAQLRRKAKEGI